MVMRSHPDGMMGAASPVWALRGFKFVNLMSGRKIFVPLILLLALAGVASIALGGNTLYSRKSDADKPDTTGISCVVDFERGEISNCLRQLMDGNLFVAPKVRKQLHFDSHGLASVFSPGNGWMYVSRKGRIIVHGVPTVDNGPDSFHDGLVRVLVHQKYGFANRKGQLVIPPTYDGAMSFDNRKAKVCKGCESKCSEADCEHHFFSGGEWFQIDTHGTEVSRVQP
jgi:hypothetical protein